VTRIAFIVLAVSTCAIGFAGGCAKPTTGSGPVSEGSVGRTSGRIRRQGRRWLAEGQHARARQTFEQAKQIAESIDDRPSLVEILLRLGDLGLPASTAFYRQAVHLSEQRGDDGRTVQSLASLAAAEERAEHTEAAATLYERAMALAKQRDDRGAQAVLLNNTGLLYQR
jgi:tetratricopeptide (TPR) repeat protein